MFQTPLRTPGLVDSPMDAPLCPCHACMQLKPLSEFDLRVKYDRYVVPRPTRWPEYLSSCRIHSSASVALEQAISRGVRRRRRQYHRHGQDNVDENTDSRGQSFLDS
jgi:hypothetical protein